MNCPQCGAPMHLKPDMESYRCDYCQSIYLPAAGDDGVRVLGEGCSDVCPLCNVALVHATVAKIRIEYCTQCHGMLVAMEIFQEVIDELRSTTGGQVEQPPADSGDLRRKINCPRCRRAMDAHYYGGPGNVVLDSCETCGVNWLDRGALMHIVRAPDSTQAQVVGGVDDFDTAAALGADAAGDYLWGDKVADKS